MGRKGNRRLYQFIDDLVSLGARELTESAGIGHDAARDVMVRIAHAMCHQHARTTFYVPLLLEIELDQRDERIWEAYQQPGPDGVRPYTFERIEQLAREHARTVRHIYSIIALVKRREQQRRQPSLPGLDDQAELDRVSPRAFDATRN